MFWYHDQSRMQKEFLVLDVSLGVRWFFWPHVVSVFTHKYDIRKYRFFKLQVIIYEIVMFTRHLHAINVLLSQYICLLVTFLGTIRSFESIRAFTFETFYTII